MVILSIITVTLNAVTTIEATLSSVTSQRHPEIEYIVIDGASTDGTLTKIRSFISKIDILISEPDRGVYDAMNKGIRAAKGRYIWFVNAGDAIVQDALKEVLKRARECRYDIIHGATAFKKKNGTVSVLEFDQLSLQTLVRYNYVPHPSTIVKRFLFQEFGLFDPTFRVVGDYEFFLRLVRLKSTLFCSELPFILSKMEHGGMSDPESGRSSIQLLVLEGYKARLRHAPLSTALYWTLRSYFFLARTRLVASTRLLVR